ncbi:DeoR/GlpR family DNA-binding transcription regulator [Roseisalinus antarcticus]|uniref:Glucitol operon repressor n=1 Tax=Roseisalinus antarcticus TaxID=254357 RepID=A0A1Y5TW07_9RHOB|nr:DeoR/GlpR family DNA-binding transcription regulator [Roseisalinus antarcticus]SLN74400.1 Glucitol operon repressor [Roseisalinus antarcticus]
MIRAERHERILSELARRGTVSAQALSAELGASVATIRRDISDLAGRKALIRTHGGASLPSHREELPFDAKLMTNLAEKRRIGAEAGARIEDGTFIACGGGTTVMQMLPSIRRKSLRLVTTAINVALELRETQSVEVTLTGGTLRRRTAETVGHIAERTLRDINIDVAIIGVDGIDALRGLTTFDPNEAYVNRVMLERAHEVWILADHSKFGEVLPAVIAPAITAARVFTDTGTSDAAAAPLQDLGIEVIRV